MAKKLEIPAAKLTITKEIAKRDYSYNVYVSQEEYEKVVASVPDRCLVKKGQTYTKIEGLPKHGTTITTANYKITLFVNGTLQCDEIIIDGDKITVSQKKSTVTIVPGGDIDGEGITTTGSVLVSGVVAIVDLGGEVTDDCFYGSP